ncbi:MAG: O-methyltransferase [Deltaproteobacteria bacterium]|jgi:catechol O-methyltransferase|nr:O-methyltransferase [Deltaproteobacteria bacterium]MBT6434497.1 O-methyltransferase [Deltaproteobacteria bacterium]MBT6492234.1 O-methyltransferase [Deltaproteobacteria bacterium]
MIPITIKLKSLLPWLFFGLRELFRMAFDLLLMRGAREKQLADYVERHAEAGNIDDALRVIDIFARKRFLMNVGIEKGRILDEALEKANAQRVLEMGCYCGYSALRTGRILQQTGGKLISLEKSAEFASYAKRVVDHAGLSDQVEIRVGSAEEQIPSLQEAFDVVFIDHWKDSYLPDLLALEEKNLLAPGATVIADNVGIFENTLVPYLDYVRTGGKYTSVHYKAPMEYFEAIDDGVEVSIWHGSNLGASA